MIKVNDIVKHELSGLYFRCENKKQERWMNMNPYYVVSKDVLPDTYFKKGQLLITNKLVHFSSCFTTFELWVQRK